MVTDRELEILKILWVRGKASVREVQDDLNKSAGPVAYSTVQTLLNIMEEKKGLVRHVVEGRTFIYIPKKSSDRTIRELTKRFVDRVFDGGARPGDGRPARLQAAEPGRVRPAPRDDRRGPAPGRRSPHRRSPTGRRSNRSRAVAWMSSGVRARGAIRDDLRPSA